MTMAWLAGTSLLQSDLKCENCELYHLSLGVQVQQTDKAGNLQDEVDEQSAASV